MYKRFEMRRSIELPVELITSHWDDPIHLMASDLTPQGAYVRSEIIPDRGDQIVCSFELLRGRPEFCFFGEVTRVIPLITSQQHALGGYDQLLSQAAEVQHG